MLQITYCVKNPFVHFQHKSLYVCKVYVPFIYLANIMALYFVNYSVCVQYCFLISLLSFQVYGSVYYIGHILYLGWPVVSPVIKFVIPKVKEEKPKEQ